ncbi:DUF1146 domain-containing protein [Clostridiaceae bacterium DONG20-135]|uniref:DUF1146 domain-containing protein n=1 Tax=Copranaerobaculum intestinale TaxID=2692629 RepID=A0A6N8U9H7_9FIRM|nr:DUF1146 domain-containing protein [Copranaerobaculum intestinale]MXQ72487.1 DUF1146 domain-containing protein [Copranaerobaculum intestinale]
MLYNILSIAVYLLSFVASFYALSSVRFERFTDVRKPAKVQTLLLLLSMGLAYVVAQFLMSFVMWKAM